MKSPMRTTSIDDSITQRANRCPDLTSLVSVAIASYTVIAWLVWQRHVFRGPRAAIRRSDSTDSPHVMITLDGQPVDAQSIEDARRLHTASPAKMTKGE